jgi:hypothetical protein
MFKEAVEVYKVELEKYRVLKNEKQNLKRDADLMESKSEASKPVDVVKGKIEGFSTVVSTPSTLSKVSVLPPQTVHEVVRPSNAEIELSSTSFIVDCVAPVECVEIADVKVVEAEIVVEDVLMEDVKMEHSVGVAGQ